MKVVVVVSDGLNVVWNFGLKFLVDLARLDGNVVFANSVDSCDVHPGLHHESPSCEDCDWLFCPLATTFDTSWNCDEVPEEAGSTRGQGC